MKICETTKDFFIDNNDLSTGTVYRKFDSYWYKKNISHILDKQGLAHSIKYQYLIMDIDFANNLIEKSYSLSLSALTNRNHLLKVSNTELLKVAENIKDLIEKKEVFISPL